ncbi:rho guanine nucleotide exchange factor 3 isoform X2 [Xiphophorus couchianus]|uniref:rho guanine nucleotide exchange factor 3 isoform X2 n=1 Tax=Xiphophorus couchianus TaxID=32473 RepID=UPI0010161067|nr:rho guanine nucleotide exchange factor 3 isoform X2 [Xiphophorus couchianus]
MVAGQRPGSVLGHLLTFGFTSQNHNMGKQEEEPGTKRSKPVPRVAALASLLPPVKATSLKRIGQTLQFLSLQRSVGFRNESRASTLPPPPPSSSTMTTRVVSATVSSPPFCMTMSRVSSATGSASKRRDSKLWSETFDVRVGATLSPKEIKRQEAIFELAQGEQDLVEDLKLAKKAYRDPMLTLAIMTEQELNQIFGTLDSLIPLHEDLLSRLRDARKPDGTTENVGHILTGWVSVSLAHKVSLKLGGMPYGDVFVSLQLPCLSSYTPYCSNQVQAKALLDQKKQDRRVQDFLQRCLQSPFSRKLDLWNFLDIPRSRLVKYPLLLREILKHTPNDHLDRQHLEEAMLVVQSVVADINRRTGESECQHYKDRLLYSEEGRRNELIDGSKTLSCHGELKNNRGIKLHVFLFQDILVITRSVSLNSQPVSYQLCRQPIPIRQLDLEDVSDGELRVGGSIRGAFSNTERTKNFFRVSCRSGSQLQTHCFQASDAFNKQQWINCIRQAKEAAGEQTPQTERRTEPEPGEPTDSSEDSGIKNETLAKTEDLNLEDVGLFSENMMAADDGMSSVEPEMDGETESTPESEPPADCRMDQEVETSAGKVALNEEEEEEVSTDAGDNQEMICRC